MFLKTLKIQNGAEVIREILFKKGLNLIIDETQSGNESGNNVGKTTVLRLIDFCLGGNGENVYKDTEFKDKTNTEIESFLKGNDINITLTLKRDLDDSASEEIVIEKNFLKNSQKVQRIDGEYYNDRNFEQKLKELIFYAEGERPTFRQIISKNIRYEKHRLENTVKVLHFSVTFEMYEALYFFWFGIDNNTAGRKQKLFASKQTEEAILKRLRKNSSLSAINQALSVIERDIDELDKKKATFNINESYDQDLASLNSVRSDINATATKLGQLNIRRDLIIEAREELQKEFANIDLKSLENIYKTAENYVSTLHVKFAEMVEFHNAMLKEKIQFITEELPELEHEIGELNALLRRKSLREQELSEKLHKAGAIEELEQIILKLTQKYEQKGAYEEQQRQWQTALDRIAEIDRELEQIQEGLASKDAILEDRISSFNKYFSAISEQLYGEQFILSQEKNDRAYELKISSIGGNLGTGKKKGQIAAFDFAYILFCDENEIPCLHFILHDQIETIHDNQLTIIANIVSDSNIQYVVPVLRDKLPADLNADDYKILSLSQSVKLFKV